MDKFLKSLKDKNIHIIGITGAEGSNILRLLVKYKITDITGHDFIDKSAVEKSFKLWHKGESTEKREKSYQVFLKDLEKIKLKLGNNYLDGVNEADIIFVPQSWRLYKQLNSRLWLARNKGIPFYSLTRLYLDYSRSKVIGVTGTVGKGSTANILVQLLKFAGKSVYFAGNETWMIQIADKLPELTRNDFLVLEISHRQILDGFNRAPHLTIITNIYKNHLDEVSWKEYRDLKLSLIKKQRQNDIAVLNYDDLIQKKEAMKLRSKVLFYSENNSKVNNKDIQSLFSQIMNINNDQYKSNILAASSAAIEMGIHPDLIKENLKKLLPLPARMELLGHIHKVNFYDDIKSTTPWATLAAVKKIGSGVLLICGGRTKGLSYKKIILQIRKSVKKLVILKSELSRSLAQYKKELDFQESADLEEAMLELFTNAHQKESILISPGAGFFYSEFIKGKKSVRKIFESLKDRRIPIFLPQAELK